MTAGFPIPLTSTTPERPWNRTIRLVRWVVCWHNAHSGPGSSLLREHRELQGSLVPYLGNAKILVCKTGARANTEKGLPQCVPYSCSHSNPQKRQRAIDYQVCGENPSRPQHSHHPPVYVHNERQSAQDLSDRKPGKGAGVRRIASAELAIMARLQRITGHTQPGRGVRFWRREFLDNR